MQQWLQIQLASAHDNRRGNSCSERTNGQRYHTCFIFGNALRKRIDVFLPNYRCCFPNCFRNCSHRFFEDSVFPEKNCATRDRRFRNEKHRIFRKLTVIKILTFQKSVLNSAEYDFLQNYQIGLREFERRPLVLDYVVLDILDKRSSPTNTEESFFARITFLVTDF